MECETLIIGAGAAGMMAAAHAGRGVVVIDHAKSAGEKIRISGGGRCNFTNIGCGAAHFLSRNPHFAKSALTRYSQWDFLDLIARHAIPWHEKTLGQLFCDNSAKDIIAMLQAEMAAVGAQLRLRTSLLDLAKTDSGFRAVIKQDGTLHTLTPRHVIVACGGKSIPKMGATGLAYDIARQFGLAVTDTRAALVPFTFSDNPFAPLSGLATPVRARADGPPFDEAMLFTHRGLSGPAMLQISSYWTDGAPINVNLIPDGALFDTLRDQRQVAGRKALKTVLAQHLPARLVDYLAPALPLDGNLADASDALLRDLCDRLENWELRPTGTEGYRTAEVTLGGVDTEGLSSQTMEAKTVPGLYFIGEAVDVTGWLGGYNFQWAWSSGWAVGVAIAGNSK
ncbi:NAD(P)/FAD-dependent oxidoreductase [Octadecabacter sp. SW4]|uniref:NAD(P)/FAD-dependent oxidoreductase n=1 Tax=Octadecabacter sp. SW4 TaxID=2602067 RepID=UPI0011C1ECE2|nr:NAD(P)/FAD-dependent oxidoreductase [Octadecabacter sp. SW4]QEE35182.1 NAD(P)/FAD-dependent oxidoreductase [Octadecabacter sp. SW4]